MKWLLSFSVLVAMAATTQAQEIIQVMPVVTSTSPAVIDFAQPGRGSTGSLAGNQNFPNFIGFISNPIQSIDPRAVTEIWPIYGAGWTTGNRQILPNGNLQLYGAGLNVALSDRLSFGVNQGGYAIAHLSNDRAQTLRNLGLPVPDRANGGTREGWLNLGGFVQYTLIADVPNQFLVTAGIRWEAPSGATQLFQGSGPPYLSPYLTVGNEFGCWHVLATTGYEFPVASGEATTSSFYANLHIDRKIGWLYPLVELNGEYRVTNVDLNLPAHHGVFDMGTFTASGNFLTVAVGANAVLVPGRLEFGAVYVRPVVTQGHFESNSLLVKMTYRF